MLKYQILFHHVCKRCLNSCKAHSMNRQGPRGSEGTHVQSPCKMSALQPSSTYIPYNRSRIDTPSLAIRNDTARNTVRLSVVFVQPFVAYHPSMRPFFYLGDTGRREILFCPPNALRTVDTFCVRITDPVATLRFHCIDSLPHLLL